MNLESRLSPEECQARLAETVGTSFGDCLVSTFTGKYQVFGKLGANSFSLEKNRKYRNSFAPNFYGRLVPFGRSTMISGEFKINHTAKFFLICWFTFLALFTMGVLVSFLTDLPKAGFDQNSFFMLALPAAMAIFGFCLVKFGRWLGRGEEQFLITFLKNTLEAHEVP